MEIYICKDTGTFTVRLTRVKDGYTEGGKKERIA